MQLIFIARYHRSLFSFVSRQQRKRGKEWHKNKIINTIEPKECWNDFLESEGKSFFQAEYKQNTGIECRWFLWCFCWCFLTFLPKTLLTSGREERARKMKNEDIDLLNRDHTKRTILYSCWSSRRREKNERRGKKRGWYCSSQDPCFKNNTKGENMGKITGTSHSYT